MISGGHTHNIAGIIDWGALDVSDRKAICFWTFFFVYGHTSF